MKYAAPARKALGIRTVFNMLGPLLNPFGAKRQVIGIFSPEKTEGLPAPAFSLGSDSPTAQGRGGPRQLAFDICFVAIARFADRPI